MSVKAPVLSQPLQLPVSEATLSETNEYLSSLTPEEILQWALTHLPGLYQTTAFGLTGLVAIDMLSKLTPNPPPLIFLDTLYHFQETYDLIEEVKARYGREVSVWKPDGCEDVKAFEAKWGDKFWEKNDFEYDVAVKVCFTSLYVVEYDLICSCR
jgi:phosphoadenosine phosphosulfate reductase